MVSSIINLNAVNGLAVLQEKFALSTIGSVLRVIDLEEVRKITDANMSKSIMKSYK